jgi:hypothetical protein
MLKKYLAISLDLFWTQDMLMLNVTILSAVVLSVVAPSKVHNLHIIQER